MFELCTGSRFIFFSISLGVIFSDHTTAVWRQATPCPGHVVVVLRGSRNIPPAGKLASDNFRIGTIRASALGEVDHNASRQLDNISRNQCFTGAQYWYGIE